MGPSLLQKAKFHICITLKIPIENLKLKSEIFHALGKNLKIRQN
jgi:hypothetical protein